MDELKISDSTVEQLIVRQFYTNGDYTHVILENYDPRFFSNEYLQVVMNISIKYFKRYGMLPGSETLCSIFRSYSEKNRKYSCKRLIDEYQLCMGNKIMDETYVRDCVIGFLKHKTMYFAILDNYDIITNKKDVSQCIEKFQKVEGIMFDQNAGFDYFRDMDSHLNDLTTVESKISTGYRNLDRVTNGGLPSDGMCLAVFMAQAGLGKSMFASNLTFNFMKQNLFPMIFSMEMSEKIYGQRIDALITGLEINSIGYNKDKARQKIMEFYEAHPKSQLLIKEFPPSTISCAHIQHFINKYMHHHRKPDVLVIDYISLLLPNTKLKDRSLYERVGSVVVEMRALSYIFKIPVVTLSQINRDGYDTSDVGMGSTSDSAVINHTADLQAVLYQQDGDREANRISMKILKDRLGSYNGGNLDFHVNYNTLAVTDMDDQKEKATVPKPAVSAICPNDILKDISEL